MTLYTSPGASPVRQWHKLALSGECLFHQDSDWGGSADPPGVGGAQAGQLLWLAPPACNRAGHMAFLKAILFLSCVSAPAHQAALHCSYPDRSYSFHTFRFSIDSS